MPSSQSHKKYPVCCFGEVLIDFLQDPADSALFRRFAGGAPANVAVAVAKLGGDSQFIGMLGQDMFGDFLQLELQRYGVDCQAIARTSAAKTALAFVALDNKGDRSFSFYRPPAADLLYQPTDCPAGFWTEPGILHLCSNSLTEPSIAATSFALVQQAKQQGWLISVDANLRHNLWSGGQADRGLVIALLQQADLIKLSEDELQFLANGQPSADWIAELLPQPAIDGKAQPRWLVVTAGANEVQSCSPYQCLTVPVTPVQVLDTTAAGDAFVGAWLYQLSHQLASGQSLQSVLQDQSLTAQIVKGAIQAGSLTCQKYGSFAALPELSEWQAALN